MRQVIRFLKTPVTMLALLALMVVAASWAMKEVRRPSEALVDQSACVMTDVGGELKPQDLQLRVLNGSDVGGLAKRTQTDLRAFGFTVIKVNNTAEEISTTVVVGANEDDPQVKLVMSYLPDSTALGDGRTDGIIDVLVGEDFVRPKEPEAATLAVEGEVCLPQPLTTESASASATPSASASKKES